MPTRISQLLRLLAIIGLAVSIGLLFLIFDLATSELHAKIRILDSEHFGCLSSTTVWPHSAFERMQHFLSVKTADLRIETATTVKNTQRKAQSNFKCSKRH
mmetsp:Transcript_7767/g.20539  ORF Transcript_7767/g.20539 Transcript_7767/m.20539 type:complete len:101 (-) Transcript_7767:141-443(-)